MDPLVPFLVSVFLQRLFAPNPPIIISKDTTFITSPIAPDGRPDYERHLLDRYRQGIAAQQNAAVDILPILGPKGYGPGEYGLVCQDLKIDASARLGSSLVSVDDFSTRTRVVEWMKQQGRPDATLADAELFMEQLNSRPWLTIEVPPIADWIGRNERTLNLLVDSTDKSQFYLPSPSLLDDRREMLLHMLLPHVTALRQACRSLCTRAMWNLGEGRLDLAWRDLYAVLRLARLVAQGHTLVEKLVGINLQREVSPGVLALLDDERLPPQLARQIRRDLMALPDFAGMADCIDHDERILLLDVVVTNCDTGFALFRELSDAGEVRTWKDSLICSMSIDWNLALRHLNQWCNRLVAAGRAPSSTERSVALGEFAADLADFELSTQREFSFMRDGISRSERNKLATDAMVRLLFPILELPVAVEDQANSRFDILKLSSALAIYRSENHKYPKSLRELVPSILPRIPLDRDSQKQFRYQPKKNGYLLYSVGLDGQDDGGSNEIAEIYRGRATGDALASDAAMGEIPIGADDYSVLMPRPNFQPPPSKPPHP